jgi:hypothetical protein
MKETYTNKLKDLYISQDALQSLQNWSIDNHDWYVANTDTKTEIYDFDLGCAEVDIDLRRDYPHTETTL